MAANLRKVAITTPPEDNRMRYKTVILILIIVIPLPVIQFVLIVFHTNLEMNKIL